VSDIISRFAVLSCRIYNSQALIGEKLLKDYRAQQQQEEFLRFFLSFLH